MADKLPDGSSGTNPDPASGGGGNDAPRTVSFETYQKTLQAEKNAKQRLQETQEKLMVFETEQKSLQEQKLLDEKKHVEFIEQLKREKGELESKASRLEREQVDFRKLNAALGLLQEKGVALEGKYLGLLPLEQINIGDDGSIDLTSVASMVQDFQKEHPRLTAPAKSFLPSDKSGSSGQQMSIEDWKKLPSAKERTEALKNGRVRHNFKF